jgi:hypothetical protein
MEVVRVMNEEDRELGLDGARVGIGVWWEWGWDGIGIGLGVWIYLRQNIPPTPQPSPLHPPLRPSTPFPSLSHSIPIRSSNHHILQHFATPVSHRNQECGRNLALVIHRTYEGQMKLLVLACDWSSGL